MWGVLIPVIAGLSGLFFGAKIDSAVESRSTSAGSGGLIPWVTSIGNTYNLVILMGLTWGGLKLWKLYKS